MKQDAVVRLLVVTAKHQDVFAMYASEASCFNVVDATPMKRDVIAELHDACKKHGLRFGVYYSHNIDWADGSDAQYAATKAINDAVGKPTSSFGANLWDPSPNTFQSYLANKAVPPVKELLKAFEDIRFIWFVMPVLMRSKEHTF